MRNCSRLRPGPLLAALLPVLSAPTVPAAHADIFTIDDIEVDVTARNGVEAQATAFEKARLGGAQRLIERLTLPEDRDEVGGVHVDATIATRLAAAVDVRRQKRSGTRYFGTLSVKFDPERVAAFLSELHVPHARSPAAPALLVPVVIGADPQSGKWRAAWEALRSRHMLAPFTIAATPYPAAAEWRDIAAETEQEKALRGIIAELARHNRLYYVRLTELRADGPVSILGVAGPFTGIAEAAAGGLDHVETAWKRLTISRGDSVSGYRVSAVYASLAAWATIRDSLQETASVSDLNVYSIMVDGADLSFSHAGSREQLAAELRARGVLLTAAPSGWVLRTQTR